jgi:hypothetical protein
MAAETEALLVLTPRQAAAKLQIGERSLWSLTAPRGPIRCVRAGRSVRYRLCDLEDWLAKAARESLPQEPPREMAAQRNGRAG